MIFRITWLISIALVFSTSYSQDYNKPDSVALSYLNSKFSSLDSLVITLTQDFNNDEDKYRVLYVYLSEKLEYKKGQDKTNLLKRNPTGNCNGISKQYQSMCQLAGLKCDVIIGEVIQPEKNILELHACNVIYLYDKKYYVDVTFSLKKEINIGKKEIINYPRCDFFFKANPTFYFLIFRPLKNKNRVVKMSKLKFLNSVRVYGSFFYLTEKITSFPTRKKIKGNTLTFEFNDEFDFSNIKLYINEDENKIYRPIISEDKKIVKFDLKGIEKKSIIKVSVHFEFGNTFVLQYVKK